jgi:hypothetical protein
MSPLMNPKNPWKIRKRIASNEIFLISHEGMFERVFRYWTLGMANQVIWGHAYVKRGKGFKSEEAYVKNGPIKDTHVLGFMDVIPSSIQEMK